MHLLHYSFWLPGTIPEVLAPSWIYPPLYSGGCSAPGDRALLTGRGHTSSLRKQYPPPPPSICLLQNHVYKNIYCMQVTNILNYLWAINAIFTFFFYIIFTKFQYRVFIPSDISQCKCSVRTNHTLLKYPRLFVLFPKKRVGENREEERRYKSDLGPSQFCISL